MTETPSFSIADDYPEYRRDVAALCADFPGDYWRALEEQPPSGSYPTAFVRALTEAGFLSALIPEAYGGWGKPVRAGAVILETIHRSGCVPLSLSLLLRIVLRFYVFTFLSLSIKIQMIIMMMNQSITQ